jgi:hypothetical protein
LELPFEKINVITMHQIFAMMPPPFLVVIVVQVATFSLDYNIKYCWNLELQNA